MSVDILIGDCLEQLRTLPDASAHMCVTSPPYWGLRNYAHDGQIGLESDPQAFIDRLVAVFREVRRVVRPDGICYVNMGDSYTDGGRGGDGTEGSTLEGSRRNQEESRKGIVRSRPFGLGPKQLLLMPARLAMAMQQDGWILRSDTVWNKPNPMPESVTDRVTKSHEYLFHFGASTKYFYDAEAIMEPISQGTILRYVNQMDRIDDHAGSTRANGGAKTNGPMKAVVRKSDNKERKSGADRGCPDGNRSNVAGSVPWASDGSHRRQYQRALEIVQEKGLTPEHLDAIRAVGLADTDRQATLYGENKSDPDQLRLAKEAMDALGAYYREFLAVHGKRNKRSVWTVATTPFKGAHFATFPTKLIEPCILAGTSARGCCPKCGAQWRRLMERTDEVDASANGSRFDKGKTAARDGGSKTQKGERFRKRDAGWTAGCDHDLDPIPCTVIDPFGGAGTTGLVAQRLNRNAILIELNPNYAAMARDRIAHDGKDGYQDALEIDA